MNAVTLQRRTPSLLLTLTLTLVLVVPNFVFAQPSAPRDPAPRIAATYRIMKRIGNTVRRYAEPDTIHFRCSTGPGDREVVSRSIEITREGKALELRVGSNGRADVVLQRAFGWNQVDADTANAHPAPYASSLMVTMADGRRLRSSSLEIPARVDDSRFERRTHTSGYEVARYTLALFPFDRPELGALNERILREFVYPDIGRDAEIEVIGYVDTVGLRDHNFRLAEKRAFSTGDAIERNVPDDRYRVLEERGVGSDTKLYDNGLPEGRFYSRAVQIIIYTPAG